MMAKNHFTFEGCLDLYVPGDKIARYIWGLWHIFTIKKLNATVGQWHYYELEDKYTIWGDQELPAGIYLPMSGAVYFESSERGNPHDLE